IHGRIVYQGMPGPVHGVAQGGIVGLVRGAYHRRSGGGDRPGGWWISMEVDLEIAGLGCRPDVLGWRRDKHPALPKPDKRGVVIEVDELFGDEEEPEGTEEPGPAVASESP